MNLTNKVVPLKKLTETLISNHNCYWSKKYSKTNVEYITEMSLLYNLAKIYKTHL